MSNIQPWIYCIIRREWYGSEEMSADDRTWCTRWQRPQDDNWPLLKHMQTPWASCISLYCHISACSSFSDVSIASLITGSSALQLSCSCHQNQLSDQHAVYAFLHTAISQHFLITKLCILLPQQYTKLCFGMSRQTWIQIWHQRINEDRQQLLQFHQHTILKNTATCCLT